MFFIVNQYWSIGSLGVEYGSILHQAVEEIWFQLAREARSRFPSSGNSRHGNISQMDWYRLARTFLATEPAQGNFCHISLTQLGQAVKRGGVEYLADPRWRALVKHWINIPLLAWILCSFFINEKEPNSQTEIEEQLWVQQILCGHVLFWDFWFWLCRGQPEIHTVSCY